MDVYYTAILEVCLLCFGRDKMAVGWVIDHVLPGWGRKLGVFVVFGTEVGITRLPQTRKLTGEEMEIYIDSLEPHQPPRRGPVSNDAGQGRPQLLLSGLDPATALHTATLWMLPRTEPVLPGVVLVNGMSKADGAHSH